MIAPYAAVQLHAVLVRRARLAHFRVRQDTVTAVEPAVRSPAQSVEDIVLGVQIPAIEHDLRRTGWLVAAFLHRNEKQVRHRAYPDAAKADLDARDVCNLVVKDLPLREMTF